MLATSKGLPKSVDEVILMLGEVEKNEEQLLKVIFEGKHFEAAQIRKSIINIKEKFKLCCHVIIGDVHRADVDPTSLVRRSEQRDVRRTRAPLLVLERQDFGGA